VLQILIWGVCALIVCVGLIAFQNGLSATSAHSRLARWLGYGAIAFSLVTATLVMHAANEHNAYMSSSL